MGMEKMLAELEQTWSVMEFEHDEHMRTGTCLLKSSEELVETLEDNQVQLRVRKTIKNQCHFLLVLYELHLKSDKSDFFPIQLFTYSIKNFNFWEKSALIQLKVKKRCTYSTKIHFFSARILY